MLNLEKEQYSKEEVLELFKPFQEEITGFKTIAQERDGALEKVKELEKDNLVNSIKLEMTKAGLNETMFDLIEAETLEKAQAKIAKLVDMRKQNKIDNSFRPEDHKQTDEYAQHEKNGNVEGMLKSKISKLFQ
ncbi:MAG TPA: hypothetical protein DD791_04940 [Syntrophomonas sp.]|jgi:hypothetical protein|nr:hypothetical protein [Syntrophomonas sp.]